MVKTRLTLKPYLGLVLKEINFAKDKTSLLVYSEKHKDIRLLPSDSVMEMERPKGFDFKLQFFAKVSIEEIPVKVLEKDLPILINRLLI